MEKKSSTKKPLVNKADLDKINNAVDHVVKTNGKYQKAFSEKERSLEMHINGMFAEYIVSESEAVCWAYFNKITKTLNDMYSIYAKYDNDTSVVSSSSDVRMALNALFKFADKVKVLRLLHVPKHDNKSGDSTISFRVYIARIGICWCRIRKSHRNNGMTIITRFTN